MFETERCFINTFSKSDYVDVKKIYENKEVRKFLGGIRQEDSIKEVLDEMLISSEDSFYWVVREKQTDIFIGLVSLDPLVILWGERFDYSFCRSGIKHSFCTRC